MNIRMQVTSALWFLVLVNYLDRVAMSFAGPLIMKSMSISPATFGIVLSSFSIGYLLAQVPGGLMSDRFGGKLLLVVGPLLWALFTGATGFVSTALGFIIVRTCFGLSEGLSNTSIYKTVGETFPAKQRARALALVSTAIPLAPAFAGALFGRLIGAYGWQLMFFLMAAPAILAAILSFLLIPSRMTTAALAPSDAGNGMAGFPQILRNPSLWILTLAAFAWNIPYWGYLGWMPSYLALGRHIDLKSVGELASIPYVFAFLGLLLGGWLGSGVLHRFCPQIVAGFFLGAGVSLFIAFEAGSLVMSLVGLSSTAFFLFGTSGPIGAIALDLAPERHRAVYVGVYNTAGQLGGAVAPAVIGLLVTLTGTFASGFIFMILGLCVAAGGFLGLIPFFMRAVSEPAPASAAIDAIL